MEQAKISEVSLELEEQFDSYLKVLRKIQPNTLSDKRKRSQLFDSVLENVLLAKLASYPTSVEEDEQALTQAHLSTRRRMAVQVRLGEKRLLEEVLALIRSKACSKTITGESTQKRARA